MRKNLTILTLTLLTAVLTGCTCHHLGGRHLKHDSSDAFFCTLDRFLFPEPAPVYVEAPPPAVVAPAYVAPAVVAPAPVVVAAPPPPPQPVVVINNHQPRPPAVVVSGKPHRRHDHRPRKTVVVNNNAPKTVVINNNAPEKVVINNNSSRRTVVSSNRPSSPKPATTVTGISRKPVRSVTGSSAYRKPAVQSRSSKSFVKRPAQTTATQVDPNAVYRVSK